jgi:hypothetical protein
MSADEWTVETDGGTAETRWHDRYRAVGPWRSSREDALIDAEQAGRTCGPNAEEIAAAMLDAIEAGLDDSRDYKQVAINTLAQAIRDIASLSNSTDRGPG